MTTFDRKVRTTKYIEYWLSAGACAKDLSKILVQASRDWHEENDWAWEPGQIPEYDDWFTLHPHDEHVIIRIQCKDTWT